MAEPENETESEYEYICQLIDDLGLTKNDTIDTLLEALEEEENEENGEDDDNP